MLAPDGQVIAVTDVDRVERSTGAVGVRVVLRDVNGVFDLTTTPKRRAQWSRLCQWRRLSSCLVEQVLDTEGRSCVG